MGAGTEGVYEGAREGLADAGQVPKPQDLEPIVTSGTWVTLLLCMVPVGNVARGTLRCSVHLLPAPATHAMLVSRCPRTTRRPKCA
jgi:hypothetical protein